MAERELYRSLWSDRILNEAKSAIIKVDPDIEPELINNRFAAMGHAFERRPRHSMGTSGGHGRAARR
jgi:hypothetical protein